MRSIGMLDRSLILWLEAHAEALDLDAALSGAIAPRLAQAELFKAGLAASAGGSDARPSEAIGAVAALAEHSMSAAFVFWAQRAFIECLAASPNRALAQRLLPALLEGRLAGAPGLSNAMKFLGGFGSLQTRFAPAPGGINLNGAVAWATNLQPAGFVVALAAGDAGGGQASVFAVPHDAGGLTRAPDLDLAALRGTSTAALQLADVRLGDEWQMHPQAKVFLPQVRPLFVGMQCGLGFGLARASLRAARQALDGGASVLLGEIDALAATLQADWDALASGIDGGRLREQPAELLRLRIAMVELAAQAVQLEVQALGGRAYLRGRDGGCMRRWREAAFMPIRQSRIASARGSATTIPVHAKHRIGIAAPSLDVRRREDRQLIDTVNGISKKTIS